MKTDLNEISIIHARSENSEKFAYPRNLATGSCGLTLLLNIRRPKLLYRALLEILSVDQDGIN